MKNLIVLPAILLAASLLTVTGCYDEEPIYCPGQCLDEATGSCIPCYGGSYPPPTDTVVPVPPPPPLGIFWEPVPSQGIIYLHTGGNSISIGPTAMLDEYGLVYVYFSAPVFNQASMLIETEKHLNPVYPRPLLVTYGFLNQPIQTGFGPIYRTAISVSICTMCIWQ